jgi:DNA-binding transcriptional regulator PaaX
MSVVHRCPYCKGAGIVTLSGVYLDTLLKVKTWCKREGYIVAASAAADFGCKETALNNRLAVLEKHGYLVSERYGRQRRFKVKN